MNAHDPQPSARSTAIFEHQNCSERIQSLEAALSIQQTRMEALFQISEATSESLLSGDTFEKIADAILSITGYAHMTISLRDTAGDYRIVAHRGLPQAIVAELESKGMVIDKVPLNELFERSQKPIAFVNYNKEPVGTKNHPTDKGFAFVPLLASGRLLGSLTLSAEDEVIWNEDDLSWLAAVGRQCGIIIHHAQLVDQLKESEVLKERQRLGRELQDSIAQVLGYSVLKEFHQLPKEQQASVEEQAQLTPRETEILEQVAAGATNPEIARALFIAESTVKKHLESILAKLHVQNRVQAAMYAVNEGLLPKPQNF